MPFFRIILRLRVPGFVVFAALIGNQISMSSLLDHNTFVEYSNLITELAAGQAVADEVRPSAISRSSNQK